MVDLDLHIFITLFHLNVILYIIYMQLLRVLYIIKIILEYF